MLPTKFRVNWHLGLGEEVKNGFSRWPPWRPSWIYDQHDFSYFWSTSHPNASCQVSSPGLSVQEKKRKIAFQDGSHGGHLGFPIGTILAILDLQVILMLPTKFRVNWLLGLGEEAKNRFSRWSPWRPSWIYNQHDFSYFWSTSHPNVSYIQLPWWPSWISDRHDFSYFWSTSHPNASYQVLSQLAFQCRRRSEK